MPSPPQRMSLPSLCIALALAAGLASGHPQGAPPQRREEQQRWQDEAARVVERVAAPPSPLAGLATPAANVAAAATSTATSSWPITASTTWYRNNNPIVDETVLVYTTTGMVTAYRPAPTGDAGARREDGSDDGRVVVETQLSHLTVTKTGVLRGGGAAPASTWTETQSTVVTLHLFAARATDLPADTPLADLACRTPCGAARAAATGDGETLSQDGAGAAAAAGAEYDPSYRPDPRCEALGLRTACQGQCKLAAANRGPGSAAEWECRQMDYGQQTWGADFVMGRACWGGNGTEYMQLNTPCIVGDYRIQCVPCKGEVYNYSPANWYGSS